MYSVDIAYTQPWFEPVHLLKGQERAAFQVYFARLEQIVSKLMHDEPDIYETALTTTLVNAIKGVDATAKAELAQRLLMSQVNVEIGARELRGHPSTSGELLDFVIETKISTPPNVWLHNVLLAEGKRLYPIGNLFTSDSRFMEFNRPEAKGAGRRSVRSALQAKTMMEVHCRAGVFFFYCPEYIGRYRAGIRVLYPETSCMMPRQPTLRQVAEDTVPFGRFMLDHLFTGRRGIPVGAAGMKSIIGRDSVNVAARYHWTLDVTLPEHRVPDRRRFGHC